ncbi:MAG: SDR family oxidoreductase [Selenomonadaceae bacterium]|nr:SDR family oxidoreductase [Selenomonadaceae bacterium]
MGNNFLLLGASSEVCVEFIRKHDWNADDRVVAQFNRNDSALIELKKNIPADMIIRQADFSSLDSTNAFVDFINERDFVPTHVLHAPAVPIDNKRFTEIDWADFDAQLNVQCRSFVLIMQSIIKKMAKAKRGKIIVTLSSYSIGVPPKFLSSYITAKYALMGLAKSLAVEYAPKNIQVNMISPSMMQTKFLEHVHPSIVEKSALDNPSKRNATAADAANLIEFLFSDESNFINGANIPIAGGEVF